MRAHHCAHCAAPEKGIETVPIVQKRTDQHIMAHRIEILRGHLAPVAPTPTIELVDCSTSDPGFFLYFLFYFILKIRKKVKTIYLHLALSGHCWVL